MDRTERKLDANFEHQLEEESKDPKERNRQTRNRAIMALCVFAAMAGGVTALMCANVFVHSNARPAYRTTEVSEAAAQVAVLQQMILSMFAGQTDYADLDDDLLISRGEIPRGMISGGKIINRFGGLLHVASMYEGFMIQLVGVPRWACVQLATMEIGESAVRVAVTAGPDRISSVGKVFTQEDADRACGYSRQNVNISWTYH